MLFNEIIWPNLFKNLKTITFTNLLIRQFIDPQFKKKQFLDEATMMVLKVSKLLAIGEIDNMRGLLTDDAIKELRPNLIKMTRQQREALAVENIILGFIYSLDVKVDKSTNPQTRQVEITCCFHSSTEPMPDGSKLPSLRKIFQSRDKHLICNYRFVRDYTKGVNGRWMINRLNHFKPEDIPRQKMAISAFILNRLRLWAVKRHSILKANIFKTFTFKTHSIFRLALIPVWNEQNQPSFIKQTLTQSNPFLPVMYFVSNDTSEPKAMNLLKQQDGNHPKQDTPTGNIPTDSTKDSSKEPQPKAQTVDDLAIKEIDGDLHKVASGKVLSGPTGGSPPKSETSESEKYIPLMPFPEVIWPGLWNLCKNLFAIHAVIHVKIDSDFDPREFLEGAREAISQISKVLASGKLEELKGFVTEEAIAAITPNLQKMSARQRRHLEMDIHDIYVGFIDLIEVKIDTRTTPITKFISITCCFHSLRDLMNFKKMYPETTFYNIMDHKDRISVSNYRFIRDYTEGNKLSGHWMINKLNHFKPLDLPQYS
uniref:Tim44-like domain-containing protein n=1 Tax=Strigamia maritima TaxID=126957 RepID=T1JDZ2_STRMM